MTTMECKSINYPIIARLQDALIVGQAGGYSKEIREAISARAYRMKRLQSLGGMYSQIEMSPYAETILAPPSECCLVKSRIDELPARSGSQSRALSHDVQ
ncbi:MAG: hypothetical protein K9M57_07045 [Phycisphaerae bacterium]|nr:hypothetical protein [Phycisphaerae bacterium]